MPRIAVFFTVAASLVGLFHYYFWARLVRDTVLPAPAGAIATAALIALGLSIPLGLLLSRLLRAGGRLVFVPYVWMGFMMLLLFALLFADGARLLLALARLAGISPPIDPERRLAIARWLGSGAALAAAAFGGAALVEASKPQRLRTIHIPLTRLPRALHGTTIVQLTDLHIGPTLGREFLEEVVARTNALSPDLIAITGDLVDGSVEQLRDRVAPLSQLRAKHGVYFVTGNHEYYSGADEWLEELRRLGVRPLRNERVSIGEGEHSFDLAGIDDHDGARVPGHGPDLPRAVEGRDERRELVLLAHQPRAIYEAVRHGVGLQLSGHTHGGQIWPWGYFVRLQQPYVAGLFREGSTHLYVSCGTGYWGPPMRLGAPSEIVRVVLEAAV